MNPIKTSKTKELYSELLSLTQLFLIREHQLTEKSWMDRDSFLFLKPFIKSQNPLPSNKIEREVKNLVPNPSPLSPVSAPQPAFSAPPPAKISEPLKPTVSAPEINTAPPLANDIKTDVSSKPAQKGFILEPLAACTPKVNLNFETFFKEHFPQYPLASSIPNDHIARKVKDNWLLKQQILPVVILCFSEQKESLTFLKTMAQAISLRLMPAGVLSGLQLEKEQQWEDLLNTKELKLIIACDYELYLHKNLMKHYKQVPQTNSHFLHQTPLLLLSELSLYLKRPELKSFLWNAICNVLK